MKPKLKHMKINTQTRKDYQKNLDNQKLIKDYKKKLSKFLKHICKSNENFFHRGMLPLFDDDKEKELAILIRDAWVASDPSIRRDHTGFIDNSQYLKATVENLLKEFPRKYDDDDVDEEYDWSSTDGGVSDSEPSNDIPVKSTEVKNENIEVSSTNTERKSVKHKEGVTERNPNVDSLAEMPTKKRKLK